MRQNQMLATHSPLRLMAAGLAVTTGVDAAIRPPSPPRSPGTRTLLTELTWTPMLLAPLAGAVQIALALRATPDTRRAATVVNRLIVGVATMEMIGGVARLTATARKRAAGVPRTLRPPVAPFLVGVLAPLAFGATGLLGLLLDRTERQESARRDAPPRPAGLLGIPVSDLLPRRLPRRNARIHRIIIRA